MYTDKYFVNMYPQAVVPPEKKIKTQEELLDEKKEKQREKEFFTFLIKNDERVHCID